MMGGLCLYLRGGRGACHLHLAFLGDSSGAGVLPHAPGGEQEQPGLIGELPTQVTRAGRQTMGFELPRPLSRGQGAIFVQPWRELPS